MSNSGYYSDCYSMHGKPDVKRDAMLELSPLSYVEKVRTPPLILQGATDERCPVCFMQSRLTG